MSRNQNKKEKLTLLAKERRVFGKKIKSLRKEGKIVANIYGKNFKSTAITIDLKDFLKIYKKAKETAIVYLNLDGKEIPVLIKNIQKHPLKNNILHVDFRKVDLKEKIETEVPIKIVGQAPAIIEKNGVLLLQTENILISALPENIPSEINIDISNLNEVGQEIKVGDLPLNKNYEILSPKDKIIVSIAAHKEQSVEPETTLISAEEIEKESKATENEKTPSSPTQNNSNK